MKSLEERLAVLADAARFDASCAISVADASRATPDAELGIYHSTGPDGRRLALLKILLTNECVFDCAYCVHRRSSDIERARFTPDEVVRLTLDYHHRRLIDGLFLSSGVMDSPDTTMEQLVEVARALRRTHHYAGYIHLKTIAGCAADLIDEAGLWADRLSVNIEMPRQADLDRLAPEKTLVQITRSMDAIRDRITEDEHAAAPNDGSASPTGVRVRGRRPRRFAPAGQTTQLIVGATNATDADVLFAAASLYGRQRLRRIYYSAYIPIEGAEALPDRPPLLRERRLYQADWLMRDYGFTAGDLTPPGAANLDLTVEPKLAWALRNPQRFPIDVNRAPMSELLRVPGFGRRTVETIAMTRRSSKITTAMLGAMRVPLARALPFVITADHTPRASSLGIAQLPDPARLARQLDLFSFPAER